MSLASVDDTAAVVVDLRVLQIFLKPMTLSFALFNGGSGLAELVVVEVEDVDVDADVTPAAAVCPQLVLSFWSFCLFSYEDQQ